MQHSDECYQNSTALDFKHANGQTRQNPQSDLHMRIVL